MAESLNYGINQLSFNDTYIIVAGIDFGTTFSAYAFSLRSSQSEIRMNRNWGAAVGFESYKAPTCIMTKPNGEFHRFGYEAEDDFSKLSSAETDPDTGYNLYRHFKMVLHKQGARLSSTVTSTSGNVRPAIDIFAMALKFLMNHMLAAINKSVASPPEPSVIGWVVTVPAIWTEESKRFMREAAFRGGLIPSVNSKQLMIALEPEAASVFCQTLESEHFIHGNQASMTKIRAGEKMIIIDAGGGTIDITAHKLTITGDIEEIIPASGGPWGGMRVDDKFVSLMNQIFGPDFLNNFKAKQPNQWLTFLIAFEKAKKTSDPENARGGISFSIPWSMGMEYANYSGKGIDIIIKEKEELGVSFNNGNFVISAAKSKEIFESVINETIQHVGGLLRDPRLDGLGYILLVGGFGECRYLQKAVTDAFSRKAKILIPLSAQLAIIKGAVMYGHKPERINSRISRCTYGCESMADFVEGEHDPDKAVWIDGVKKCENLFIKLIKKNQLIQIGNPYKFEALRPTENTRSASAVIYSTYEDNATYIDEPHVTKLGEVALTNQGEVLGKELELQLTFGGTEFLVEARDKSKGDDFPVNLTIDFLQD